MKNVILLMCVFLLIFPVINAEMPQPIIQVYDGSSLNNNLNWVNATQVEDLSANETDYWNTNNGSLSGINITQFENNNGLLHAVKSWWDGLYCQLTGCTMEGDINMGGNNITNIGNVYNTTEIIGFGYYNSSDFEISDYYLKSNPYNFYNSSDFSIGDYVPYTGATGNVDLGSNDLTVNTDTLFVDSVNDKVGIGTTAPSTRLHLAGTTTSHLAQIDTGLNFDQVDTGVAATTVLENVVGNVDAGTHYYGYTFTTELGETSMRRDVSTLVTTDAANGQVTVTIPTSTDYRVTGRKIYRSKAGQAYGRFYLLDTITNNIDTTYLDNKADSELGSLNKYRTADTTNSLIKVNGVASMALDEFGTNFGVGAGGDNMLLGGYSNTNIGYEAGKDLTTGYMNVMVGQRSGYATTTSSGNTMVGALSGYKWTGSSNVLMGIYAGAAGFSEVTGHSNVMLGSRTAYNAPSGAQSYNVLVGDYAGRYLAGSKNVFLGNQAGYYETGSNKLFIDNTARANEADAREKALIYGVFDADTVNQDLFLNADVFLRADNRKLYFGAGDDYSQYFDGTNQNFDLTSGNFVFNGGNVGIGTTTPQNKLNVIGDFNQSSGNSYTNGIYGGFAYFNESGKEFSFDTQDVYYNFSGGDDCGLTNGVTCEDTNKDKLLINYSGVYTVGYGATGLGVNNHVYIIAVGVNGEPQNRTRDLMKTSSQELHKMAEESEIRLYKGDVLTLMIKDSTGTSTGTVYEFDFNIHRIGN